MGYTKLSKLGGPDGIQTRDVSGNHKVTGGRLEHSFHLFAREAIDQQS